MSLFQEKKRAWHIRRFLSMCLAFAILACMGVGMLTLSGCGNSGAGEEEIQDAAEAEGSDAEAADSSDEGSDAGADGTAEAEDSSAGTADSTAGNTTYSRVVALSKSISDLWLLSGGELVGTTEDALELEGIGDAVSVGTISKPSIEAILALEPDLVLVSAELSPHLEIKEKLDSMGIQTMSVEVNNFEDYKNIMKELTDQNGHPELYEEHVEKVAEEIDEICESANTSGEQKGTYLALRVSSAKNKALKNDYFACEIFNNLGLVNVVEDTSEMDDLNMEWIAASSPDYIFIVFHGDEEGAQESLEEAFTSQPFWNELDAVKNGHTFIMPKDLFQNKPNGDWAKAYEYAYGLIYGE